METKVEQVHSIEAQEVEDIVRENLAAFARGDFDSWGAAFAQEVFFTAADPEEVFSKREDAIAEMHRDFDFAFDEGLQIDIEPQSIHIGVSADGRVAWSAGPLRYTVSFQGETNSFILRHTNVFSKVGDQWPILATQYSLTLPESKIMEALTGGYLPAPNAIGDARRIGAQSLFKEFIHQLADLSTTTIGQDAYVFGPFPEESAEGQTEVRALFAKCTSRWGTLYLRPDGIRAELASEEMGWVGANVQLLRPYANQKVPLPLRALVVYQKERENWTIVHAHLSVGIPDELAE